MRKTLTRKIVESFPLFMHKMMQGFDFTDSSAGLNKTQEKTLHIIFYHGTTHMGDIISHLNMEKGSFTPVVDSLIEKGLINKERDHADRRKINLTLSDRGRRHVEKMEERLNDHLQEKLQALSAAERKRLLRVIDDLYELTEKL